MREISLTPHKSAYRPFESAYFAPSGCCASIAAKFTGLGISLSTLLVRIRRLDP